MKKMRMIIAFALVLSMILAFGACGQKATEESAASESPAGSVAPETSAAEAPADDGVLTMATNAAFSPYEYYEGDKIVGIDAEIAALIAEKLSMTLQIEDMEFDSVVTSVSSGKTDMAMAALTDLEERRPFVDFSTSYATGKQVIIVPADSTIAGPDDLTGKKIGVQIATTGDIYCSDDYGTDAVERYNKGADAVMALTQGKIDAVVIDNEPAKVFVSQNEGLKILETEYTVEDYCIAVKKGNTALLDKINTALAELTESGDVKAIVDKYISAD